MSGPVTTLVDTTLRAVPHGRRRALLTVLLSAGASGAAVALMGTSAWLLSRAAEHPPILYLMVAITAVRTFGISRAVLRYVERLVGHDLALGMQSALRLRVYDVLSRTILLGRSRGDLLVRIVDDVRAVMDAVVRVLVPFTAAGVVAVATTVLVGLASPVDGAVLGLSAILAGGLVPWIAQRASARADTALAPLRGELADAVTGLHRTAPDLVAYGVQDRALARIEAINTRLTAAEERAARVRGLSGALQVAALAVAVVGALLIGSRAVVDGRLPGVMLAVLVLTPLALHEVLEPLAEAAQTWTRVRSALGRVGDVLAFPATGEELGPVRSAGGPAIDVRGLTVGWPGGEPVVRGLDLQVRAGERVALVGRSGLGKTTVAATVMGLLPPLAGEVEVHGTVGYLAQDAHVFDTSVAENVLIGRKDASREEIVAALHRAGLALAPDHLVGEHGGRLSGGEARRLAAARLFVGAADVVILDEPTEHLDEETAEDLLADLWTATDGAAVLVITHDPVVRDACDRVVDLAAYALMARWGNEAGLRIPVGVFLEQFPVMDQ
ncbi:ATP-binding cassette, subfamily C, CydC [Raineyella antarctica]|uniref:ATP-binding cassette, subfamily C, CydC n=1 Tax=Raineyella antarctica TaxID=1577474 RepID=A0A1G6GF18_9ACTN|nr:thiol reductant ABC exporter subunit CydC [Raineyella antarctica]SDB80499.1 ATP-binding cassette, subfamily C, CydC [Raineyella antarctica]